MNAATHAVCQQTIKPDTYNKKNLMSSRKKKKTPNMALFSCSKAIWTDHQFAPSRFLCLWLNSGIATGIYLGIYSTRASAYSVLSGSC